MITEYRATRPTPMLYRWLYRMLPALCLLAPVAPAQEAVEAIPDPAQMRGWIERMKSAPRGPFRRIRWFCFDGAILPPEEGACSEHEGGRQHGEWNEQVLAVRAQGYLVANLLTELNSLNFIGTMPHLDELRQVLLEQFLIRNDDGWVFRQARYYRGALQVEDERAGARVLLLALVQDPGWRDPARYLLLREAARLLPVAAEPPRAVTVRRLATELAEADPGFLSLRVKLHSLPDTGDPQRVREFAGGKGLPELADRYRQLADELDSLYAPNTAVGQLQRLIDETTSRAVKERLRSIVADLRAAGDSATRLQVAAEAADGLRTEWQDTGQYSPPNQLRLLQANLALEEEVYALANRLLEEFPDADRMSRLQWLRSLGRALLSGGFLSERQWQSMAARLDALGHDPGPDSVSWYEALVYLARVPQWSQRALEFQFGPTVEQWQQLTPLAAHYVPDRLRGSPLLAYTRILDGLLAEAAALVGIDHYLFERKIASGLRGLNPGLRRGVLLAEPAAHEDYRRDGIYLLPATTPELPPVAGILTRGEGSSLSHVQLLARNLGIPNVVVDERLVAGLQAHVGERIVLAVSPRGTVQVTADGPHWDAVFGREQPDSESVIRPDLAKLDLASTTPLALQSIRAGDSGRIVGPKAANLGELGRLYPDAVNPGVVVPFGVFRELLQQPIGPGGPPAFEWLRAEYARLRAVADEQDRAGQTRDMLERLRDWITTADPGEGFRNRLRAVMQQVFGDVDSVGVFVRSDTNVEDLPGFTGAGLNLTVPNVVGFDAVLAAISRVWASPFTERAYAWRQAHMDQPEHVYPAVLLLQTFPAEKSGVLVSADVENGDRDWLSVAVSEGVGGAVEGQAAEELRVYRSTGEVRLLAQATAPLRAEPVGTGGMRKVPASGTDTVLQPDEIAQLRELADDVERRFPLPAGRDGLPVAADIEFGFRAGRLALFQIRPFVESLRARRSRYLIDIDRASTRGAGGIIDLHAAPAVPVEE